MLPCPIKKMTYHSKNPVTYFVTMLNFNKITTANNLEGGAEVVLFSKNGGGLKAGSLIHPFFCAFRQFLSDFDFSVTNNVLISLKPAPVLNQRYVTKCNNTPKNGGFCYILLQIVTRLFSKPKSLLHFVTSYIVIIQLIMSVTNVTRFSSPLSSHFNNSISWN